MTNEQSPHFAVIFIVMEWRRSDYLTNDSVHFVQLWDFVNTHADNLDPIIFHCPSVKQTKRQLTDRHIMNDMGKIKLGERLHTGTRYLLGRQILQLIDSRLCATSVDTLLLTLDKTRHGYVCLRITLHLSEAIFMMIDELSLYLVVISCGVRVE